MDIQIPPELSTPELSKATIKHFDIHAKVIRADGNVEDYGIIAGWDKNIFKHFLLQLQIVITRVKIYYGKRISKRR